ncbi:MAG: dihydropteroate synthase [Mycetocola sp.]|nr:dihydropteroate synthase [Mycetocola sp.]
MTERPVILGVLNVTPDSFSDGGRFTEVERAVAHAERLRADGADWIDVGGESTRPGAGAVTGAEELRRVLPIVEALVERAIPVSIDTLHAATAEAAVAAGAGMVNDVSGGLADPGMAATVARLDVPYVLSHWRGPSDRMNELAVYDDVVAEVRAELAERLAAFEAAGVDRSRIVLDPGLGFSKDAGHNWALLGALDELGDRPVLVGASRKRFLAALPGVGSDSVDGRDPRDLPTAVVSALAARAGAWGVRVHDVAGTRIALDVATAWGGTR